MRASRLPPYSSVRLLYWGERKPPSMPWAWAAWTSTPSTPAFCMRSAASPNWRVSS